MKDEHAETVSDRPDGLEMNGVTDDYLSCPQRLPCQAIKGDSNQVTWSKCLSQMKERTPRRTRKLS